MGTQVSYKKKECKATSCNFSYRYFLISYGYIEQNTTMNSSSYGYIYIFHSLFLLLLLLLGGSFTSVLALSGDRLVVGGSEYRETERELNRETSAGNRGREYEVVYVYAITENGLFSFIVLLV